MKLETVDQILHFAIGKEQDAANFYTELASRMQREQMKDVFRGFAREEMGHKAKLEAVRKGQLLLSAQQKITDLGIGDHLTDIELQGELDYQQALIVAMKAEKAAFKLYLELADATDNAELRDLLLSLANEEARHKLRFEIEYDDVILTEN
jgi:rubrerythrin